MPIISGENAKKTPVKPTSGAHVIVTIARRLCKSTCTIRVWQPSCSKPKLGLCMNSAYNTMLLTILIKK